MDNWIYELNQYTNINFICARMEVILSENKAKCPNKDFKEQQHIIKMLREFEHNYLELSEYKRQLRKLLKEIFEENTTLKISTITMAKEIEQLKKENEILKQNISI